MDTAALVDEGGAAAEEEEALQSRAPLVRWPEPPGRRARCVLLIFLVPSLACVPLVRIWHVLDHKTDVFDATKDFNIVAPSETLNTGSGLGVDVSDTAYVKWMHHVHPAVVDCSIPENRAGCKENWKEAVVYAANSNAVYPSFRLDADKFSGLSFEEFGRFAGRAPSELKDLDEDEDARRLSVVGDTLDKKLPASWNATRCHPDVRDQGNSSSGWCFASTAAVSAGICARWGKKVDLSTQQGVDCIVLNKGRDSVGCHAGPEEFFEWARLANVRLMLESAFPYNASKTDSEECPVHSPTHCPDWVSDKQNEDNSLPAGLVHSMTSIPNPWTKGKLTPSLQATDPLSELEKTEQSIKHALLNHYGLVVSVYIHRKNFMIFKSYTAGVVSSLYNETQGSILKFKLEDPDEEDDLDAFTHEMLLVGFGTETDSHVKGKYLEYWILQNSWGSDWGEAGYMRVQAGEFAWHVIQLHDVMYPILRDDSDLTTFFDSD